jgi:two-component system response regulator HydG
MGLDPGCNATRLLLVGAAGDAFCRAAAMARAQGADVAMAENGDAAMVLLRAGGADVALVDVAADAIGFIARLRAEQFALPVFACGIDAPAALAVAAIRAGAVDYLPLPPDAALIAAAILSVARHDRALVGEDPAFRRVVALGLLIAGTRAPFLIQGEPGTGKEMLARAIHAASGVAGRFVAVDCADIGPDMIDYELFGHEPGAFAGAVARRHGRIEQAADGVLYLREAGLLPLATQARLLRLIEDRTLLRMGSAAGGPGLPMLQARIVAGTSLNLDARVTEGRFRAGLLARLGLVRLPLPALRERPGDIALLAAHLADRLAHANGLLPRPLAPAALAVLAAEQWPANVRGLEDVIHRALLFSHDAVIAAASLVHADGSALASTAVAPRAAPIGALVGSTVNDVERDLILATLKRCRGNRTSASTILGISVRTMRNKLKTFVEAGIIVSPPA